MTAAQKRDILICGVQFDKELKSGEMSVLDLAPIAKRLGAAGVEYREIWWRDKMKEIPAVREQLAQLGLKGTYATFTTLYNRDPAKQQQLMQDLEDGYALGSPLMRVFRGKKPGDGPEDAGIRAASQRIIDRAASYGMTLALGELRGCRRKPDGGSEGDNRAVRLAGPPGEPRHLQLRHKQPGPASRHRDAR